eukprot:gb/GEZJ01000338.1/.p3 GENE.gb/GEZJ01000338.1/~~gb/GEZJ01000338.1/.p3  ORF type:complete len:231 (-),score=33.73 gb/GEZJ01000338.1/:3866-4558(-)
MRKVEEICFSRFRVSSEKYEDEPDEMYFRNGVSLQVLREFLGYDVQQRSREAEEEYMYVDGRVVQLGRLDAWIQSVVRVMDCNGGRDGRRQILFTNMFSKYLPLAVEGTLETARGKAKEIYREELEHRGVSREAPRHVFGNSKWVRTVALWMPSKHMVYLAVREEVFMSEFTDHLGCVADCYVGSSRPDEMEFEALRCIPEVMLSSVHGEEDHAMLQEGEEGVREGLESE